MKRWIARMLTAVMLLSLLCVGAQAAESYEEVTFEATGLMFGHVTGKVSLSQARAVMTDYGTVDYYAVPEEVTVTVTPYGDSDGMASLVGLRCYDAVASDGGGESYENMNYFLLTSAGTLREIGDHNAFWAADKNSGEYALTANQTYTFTIDTTAAGRIDLLCSRPNDLGVEQVAVLRCQAAPAGEAPAEEPAGETPAEEPVKSPFTDVAETSAYYDGILWAVEQGITQGTGDGTTFSPDASCTRAQIAVFLWRAAGSPEPTLTQQQFADVDDPGAYYYKAVQWAAEMDMEYSGTFSPYQPCTRLEAVYFMWRAAGSPEMEQEPPFTDVVWEETEHGGQPRYREAGDAIAWAVEKGVTRGTTETTFSPDRVCTRGQIATFLYRAANAAAGEAGTTPAP